MTGSKISYTYTGSPLDFEALGFILSSLYVNPALIIFRDKVYYPVSGQLKTLKLLIYIWWLVKKCSSMTNVCCEKSVWSPFKTVLLPGRGFIRGVYPILLENEEIHKNVLEHIKMKISYTTWQALGEEKGISKGGERKKNCCCTFYLRDYDGPGNSAKRTPRIHLFSWTPPFFNTLENLDSTMLPVLKILLDRHIF